MEFVHISDVPADALFPEGAAYDTGDYRWGMELVNHAVFADPTLFDLCEPFDSAFEIVRP